MAHLPGKRYLKLEGYLLGNASRFSFVQAYKLLCRLAESAGRNPIDSVSIRPALGLEFALAEIHSVIKTSSGDYILEVNLPGLYGNASPLPNYMTDALIRAQQQEQTGARMFFDLLHLRLYQLLFKARERYSSSQNTQAKNELHKLMLSMMGLREYGDKVAPEVLSGLIQHINIFRQLKGTRAGLLELCRHLFPGCQVQIEQFCESSCVIPEQAKCAIGKSYNKLGDNCLIGTVVKDVSSCIKIKLGPLAQSTYTSLVTNRQHWHTIVELIRICINEPLSCVMEFDLVADAEIGCKIKNGQSCALGVSGWLYSDSSSGTKRAKRNEMDTTHARRLKASMRVF